MSVQASEQFRRILQLLPSLADGQRHSIAELAKLAEVDDARELWAEIGALADHGDEPGGFVPDVQIFLEGDWVTIVTPHFRRPMRLTMAELCALELGLGVLRRERTPDELAPIDGALARLRDTITEVQTNEAYEGIYSAELAANGNPDHLATVRGAVQSRHKVRFTYLAGSAREATERVVRPYMLMFSSGMWYIVAYCERSESVRYFRLDRVQRAQALEQTFGEPDVAVLEKVVREQKAFGGPAPATMTVRYSPAVARWIHEREGGELAADGSLTREYPLADLGWGVRHVLQYGPDAEVLSPPELREEIARRLDALVS